MRTIFFSLLVYFCLFACKNNQDTKVNQQLKCYVRILETEGEVLAEATLLKGIEGQQPQPSEVKGGLRYQGTTMDVKPQYGLTYRSQFKGRYTPEHVFSWDDENGQRYSFKTSLYNTDRYSFGSKTLSRKNRVTLSWQGQPMGTGESMVLLWENPKNNLTVPMEIYGAQPQPSIEFPAAKIAELTPGEWTVYLVRKRLMRETINDVPCEAVLEFYSQTDTLTITD